MSSEVRYLEISEENVTAALELFVNSMHLLSDEEHVDGWSTLGGPLQIIIRKEVLT